MTTVDKVLADISSGYWWFSAVVVALALNLLSAYVKPWLDRRLDRLSATRRAFTTKQRQEFEDHVEAIASDPYLLLLERLNELRDRVQLLYYLIGCILMVALVGYFSKASKIAPFERYFLVTFCGIAGVLAYLFFFRLVVRSNESARRFEAAIASLAKRDEA